MNKIKSIQVLGSGCPSCKRLFELTKQAATDLGLKIEVEYSSDIQKIIELGVMSSPVLAVNGQAVLVGQVPDIDKIKDLINATPQPTAENKRCGCSCGGNC